MESGNIEVKQLDKYEYRLKTEEMLKCVAAKDYKKAETIADSIDWRRVKSVSMLCTVSDIYDENERYNDAREILFIAYDRAPSSRKIIFGLAELAIKIGDLDEAADCYNEFVSVAPKDGNQYVLKYELSKAKNEPIEKQIEALEEFKQVEYIERWAFELAKLYEKAGMTAKCIEECDDLVLWFNDGKYVRKAMELKQKYKPLTPLQTERYQLDTDEEELTETQREANLLLEEERKNLEKQQESRAPRQEEDILAEDVLAGNEDEAVEEAAEESPSEDEDELSRSIFEMAEEYDQSHPVEESSEEVIEPEEIPESEEAYTEPEEEIVEEEIPEEEAPIEEIPAAVALEEEAVRPAQARELKAEFAEDISQQVEEARLRAAAEAKRLSEERARAEEARKLAVEEEARKREEAARREDEEETEEEASEEAPGESDGENVVAEALQERITSAGGHENIAIKPVNVGIYDTMNLQAEIARGMAEIMDDDEHKSADAGDDIGITADEAVTAERIDEPTDEMESLREALVGQLDKVEAEVREETKNGEKDAPEPEEKSMVTGDTTRAVSPEAFREVLAETEPEEAAEAEESPAEEEPEAVEESPITGEPEAVEESLIAEEPETVEESPITEEPEPLEENPRAAKIAEDENGQLTLVQAAKALDEEKQITGQMNIEDILSQWEVKQAEMEKSLEESRKKQEEETRALEAMKKTVQTPSNYIPEDIQRILDEIEGDDEDWEDSKPSRTAEPADEAAPAEIRTQTADSESESSTESEPEETFEPEETPEPEEASAEPPIIEEEEAIPAPSSRRSPVTRNTIPLPGESFAGNPDETAGGLSIEEKFDLEAQSRVGTEAGLTEEEKRLFSYFVPVRGMSEQLVEVLRNDREIKRDGTSQVGNLIVIGRKGSGKTVLAVDVVKAIQKSRKLKSGKVAIISAESLNKKDIPETVRKIHGGSLIIENAGKLSQPTIDALNMAMTTQTGNLLIVLEDQRQLLSGVIKKNPNFAKKFTSRLEVPIFINDELVTFGQAYAKEHGYKIEEMAILALYSRIDAMQREDHAVTVAEVKDIMDTAFVKSKKNSMKRTMTNLFKSRDKSDRILLMEEDFAK